MIMKKKYVNNLPNGKEVIGTEVSVEDGKLVVEIEFKEEFKPKDGDFLVSRNCKVFIFNGRNLGNTYGAYCGVNSFDEIVKDIHTNFWTYKEGCRFATPEEKSAFLERLEKECHKTWNAEKKCLEDVYVPKFGDIVRVDLRDNDSSDGEYMICVYPNANNFFECNEFFNIVNLSADKRIIYFAGSHVKSIKEASESEKKELFDKLAEVGKKWNPETKKLEDIRWTPKKGDKYFFIDCFGIIQCTINLAAVDSFRIETNNCFKTEEAAQPYADKFKELLKNSKAE